MRHIRPPGPLQLWYIDGVKVSSDNDGNGEGYGDGDGNDDSNVDEDGDTVGDGDNIKYYRQCLR